MADDFTAVPGDRWYQLRERVAFQGVALFAAIFALALLITALARKGIVSWADFRVTPAGG